MSPRLHVVLPFVTLVPLAMLAGCGGAHHATSASGRVVDVVMQDNRYDPAQLAARRGEVVTFRFSNRGAVRHEALVGDDAAQEAHHREMQAGSMATGSTTPMAGGAHGDGGHHGSQPTMVVVDPGGSAELTVTVPETGTLLLGCHEPGHWEAGMKLTIARA